MKKFILIIVGAFAFINTSVYANTPPKDFYYNYQITNNYPIVENTDNSINQEGFYTYQENVITKNDSPIPAGGGMKEVHMTAYNCDYYLNSGMPNCYREGRFQYGTANPKDYCVFGYDGSNNFRVTAYSYGNITCHADDNAVRDQYGTWVYQLSISPPSK